MWVTVLTKKVKMTANIVQYYRNVTKYTEIFPFLKLLPLSRSSFSPFMLHCILSFLVM